MSEHCGKVVCMYALLLPKHVLLTRNGENAQPREEGQEPQGRSFPTQKAGQSRGSPDGVRTMAETAVDCGEQRLFYPGQRQTLERFEDNSRDKRQGVTVAARSESFLSGSGLGFSELVLPCREGRVVIRLRSPRGHCCLAAAMCGGSH